MLRIASNEEYRSADDLFRVPVPDRPRWRTDAAQPSRWSPIPHGELATEVAAAARRAGASIQYQRYSVTNGGSDLLGFIALNDDVGKAEDERFQGGLALRHSNAGRRALEIGAGGVVFVCSNGMLISDQIVKRKHCEGLDLRAMVEKSVAVALDDLRRAPAFVQGLRAMVLTPRQAWTQIGRVAQARAIPVTLLPQAVEQWNRPWTTKFKSRTAWSLYNAFTEVVKQRTPLGQRQSLAALRDLFDPQRLRACLRQVPEAPRSVVSLDDLLSAGF